MAIPLIEINSFDTGHPIAGPWHFFFLVVADLALVRDGFIILWTVRLALLGLFFHFFSLQRLQNATFNLSENQGQIFSKILIH